MSAPAVCALVGLGDRTVYSVLIPIPSHHLHNVGGDGWMGIAGLGASVACLIIAVADLFMKWRRKRRARKAFRVPQLVAIVEDLEAAIAAHDPQRIKYQLERWRREAAHVYGLLIDAKSDEVLRCMSKSLSLARAASNALLRSESAVSPYMDARDAIMNARDAITAARDALITWVSRQSRRGGPW